MSKYCYSLLCAPEVEEKLLDALLTTFDDEIFTSMPVFSHGTAHGRLSAVEQVLGRSRSVFVQILVTDAEAAVLNALLHRDFAGTGIRFWMTSLVAEGEIA